jgi:hypothetical protein
MKNIYLTMLVLGYLASKDCFSQNATLKAITQEGKTVTLYPNNTWQYSTETNFNNTASQTEEIIAAVRSEIERSILQKSKGELKLISIEKTDGQSRNAFGIEGYEMDFKLIVEFQRSTHKCIAYGGWFDGSFCTTQ